MPCHPRQLHLRAAFGPAVHALQEVAAELEQADCAMEEATTYSKTLALMTDHLHRDISGRRKKTNEIERKLGEVRRELKAVTIHMRALQSAERDVVQSCEKLTGQIASKRRVQEEHLGRRETMLLALRQGGGRGGSDLVADAEAAEKERKERLLAMLGQQVSHSDPSASCVRAHAPTCTVWLWRMTYSSRVARTERGPVVSGSPQELVTHDVSSRGGSAGSASKPLVTHRCGEGCYGAGSCEGGHCLYLQGTQQQQQQGSPGAARPIKRQGQGGPIAHG